MREGFLDEGMTRWMVGVIWSPRTMAQMNKMPHSRHLMCNEVLVGI